MNTYDPFMFGEIPEDAITDTEALGAYMAQPDMPFLEDNTDLPASETDPRGLLKPDAMQGAPMMADGAQAAGALGDGNGLGAPEGVEDPEALQQAILDAQSQYNSDSMAYQDATVQENDEAEKEALKIEEGLA